MNKKIRIIVVILALPIIALVILNSHLVKELFKEKMSNVIAVHADNENAKESKDDYELQVLYEHQNSAFAVNDSLNNAKYYHDSSYVNTQQLVVYLYTYNMDYPDRDITVQDIIDYLDKEYDKEGALMVYSCPDHIKDYIDWWWSGGSSKISYFSSEVIVYLSKNGYEHAEVYSNLSIEELQEILPLVEKAKDDQ